MPDNQWDQMLAASAGEVLETMFFTGVYGPAEESGAAGEPHLAARLTFSGSPSGALTLSVTEPAVRALADNFLPGEDGQPPALADLGAVVCELANMICGSLLSRVQAEEHFRLSSPELMPGDFRPAQAPTQSLDVGDGVLNLWLVLENHAA